MKEINNSVAKMMEPFAANEINQIPKGNLKLDYVGHAALTKRLLETDLNWSWEPFAVDADGLPKLDELGGLWIRLTVCGITRIGYGDAGNSRGTQAIKEAIGDALRNAGMRFGAALDLWHKGDLFDLTDSRGNAAPELSNRSKKTTDKPVVTYTAEQIEMATQAIDLLAVVTTVEELRNFYIGAQEAGFLHIAVNGQTVNAAITAKKKALETN